MQNGLYRVLFQASGGKGTGVIILQDGKLQGGDSMMFYVGTYTITGSEIAAEVRTGQHSSMPGMRSVLGTAKAILNIKGKIEGSEIVLEGSVAGASDITIDVIMTRLESL